MRSLFSDPRQARVVIAAFLVGFITMAHEIVMGRVFGTFFGTSTLTWSGVIAAYILAIGIGYAFGGWLSRYRRLHGHLLGLSLVLIALMPILLELLFRSLVAPWAVEFVVGLIVSSLPLLAVAAYLPALIAQRHGTKADASSTVLASDTIGSVLGILTAGVIALPALGVWKGVGVLTIASALLLVQGRARIWAPAVLIAGAVIFLSAPEVIPSPFSDIEIHRDANIVELRYGPSSRQSAMNVLDPTQPVYQYSQWIDELAREHVDADEILMLGAGGCTHVPMLRDAYPSASFVVVDNNPTVFEVCAEYFGIAERSNIEFVVADARRFLQEPGSYDLILVDTFGSLCTVPEHLLTYEFHQELSDRVAPGGSIIMNTIFGSNESKRVIERNLAASFEIVEVRTQPFFPGNRVFLLEPDGTGEPLITDDRNPYSLLLSRECLG